MVPNIIRTHAADPRFQALIKLLDQSIHGHAYEAQAQYDQLNQMDPATPVVLIVDGDEAIACGAFREIPGESTIEIKRMYVKEAHQGKGFGRTLLTELEQWAIEKHHTKAVLETGKEQTSALHLYEKTGYQRIPNFGPYIGLPESICMGKALRPL